MIDTGPQTFHPSQVADHATRVVLEERIAELWHWRQWYRRNQWADWSVLRREQDIELRALVKLARKARRIAAGAPDPIEEAQRWWDRNGQYDYFGTGPR